MNKLFNTLIGIIVSTFFVVAGLLIFSSFDIPGLVLDARVVQTGSMEPTILTGSLVFIYPKNNYGVDDIITFSRTESILKVPITHRIVEETVDETGQRIFFTKGDANENRDTVPVKEDEIFGEIILTIPYVGRLLEAAKTPWGFAALIVIPALLVIIDEFKKIKREFVLRRQKKEISENKSSPDVEV